MAERTKKSEDANSSDGTSNNGEGDHGATKNAKHEDMNTEHEAKERLGTGLRSLYRGVLEEPLPADMMALLDQLDDSDGENDKENPENMH